MAPAFDPNIPEKERIRRAFEARDAAAQAAGVMVAPFASSSSAGISGTSSSFTPRIANGTPNGVLSEGAVLSIVWPRIAMMSTTAELQESMIAAMDNYHSEGYTGFIDMAMVYI